MPTASTSSTTTLSSSRRAAHRDQRQDAYGVYALSNTTIQNASTTIGTTDNGSHAINLSGIGNVVSQVGAITTKGNDAYGVYSAMLTTPRAPTPSRCSWATASGLPRKKSYGMRLGDFSEPDIAYGASITTTGIDAHALFASTTRRSSTRTR